MGTVDRASYFCSGCGAIRQQGARRCSSCGRVFDDESNASETIYALTHPQVKAPYRKQGPVSKFFENIFAFHSVITIIAIVMLVVAARALLPYVFGIKAEASVTKLEALNCKADCQYLVDYQFTDISGNVRTGQYHWSYKDFYFYPPKEGQPTVIKYIPYLTFMPPVAIDAWFPWGMFVMAGLAILALVAVKKNWI